MVSATNGLHHIRVGLEARPYDVAVGAGASSELASLIPASARRAAIVTQANIGISVDPGCEHRVFEVVDGEEAKTMSTVEDLCRDWARWGLTRADVVVGVGGGVVTDLAGFAAASYHRGTAVVHVATSLLGMVDAAIGGKCGVNLPEGKNLVGAFWQPHGVICDTDHLATLPPAELRSGMGEVAKYEFLRRFDAGDTGWSSNGSGGVSLVDMDRVGQVAACAAIKASVVAADEREGGLRAVLNYGHTLAHALETSGGYGLRHGEAVAVGLVYAGELAFRLGRIDDAARARHHQVVADLELPGRLPEGSDLDELQGLFVRDKKALDGVTFVLDGADGVERVTGVEPALLRETLEVLR